MLQMFGTAAGAQFALLLCAMKHDPMLLDITLSY